MDYSRYENYEFAKSSAINVSTGYKGRSYETHWHSYGEIILVGPGDTNVVKVNQSTYNLVEDDFVIAWPMETHAIIDANRAEALIIQFSNAFVNSLFDLQRIMHFYRSLHVICINNHPELAKKLKDIVLEMKDIYFNTQTNRELRCCMLLMQFMQVLDEHREEFMEELSTDAHDPYEDDVMRRMMLVTDYIKHNLTADDLSQGAMAQMAGISRDYFSRIFKNVTGMNYSKWLNMIRLEKATELLPNKGMSLTEIAMLSGFQSIPSFNRVFHDDKGMSPGEYRTLFVDR